MNIWNPGRDFELRTAIVRAALLAILAAAIAVAGLSPTPVSGQVKGKYQIQLKLESSIAGMIGQREMPLNQTLLRGLRVSVQGAREPLRVALFAAVLREGKVASIWWSPQWTPPIRGEASLPGEKHLPGSQYVTAADLGQGTLYIGETEKNLPLSGEQFLPPEKYLGSRFFGLMSPGRNAVPADVQQMAEKGVVLGQRIDWKRQQVLYLAIVPVDGNAASLTAVQGVAFAKSMPDY
jgi:hypothetical protein